VVENRAKLSIEKVATGEHWYGIQALALGLVDRIETSDDFLLAQVKDHDVYEIRYRVKRGLREQLLGTLTRVMGLRAQGWKGPSAMMQSLSPLSASRLESMK